MKSFRNRIGAGLQVFFLIAVCAHLLMSGYRINKWFSRWVVPNILATYNIPVAEQILTKTPTERDFVVSTLATLPEDAHILWLPVPDPLVNYYIFPRRMYRIKEYAPEDEVSIDPDFISSRGIQYIMKDFVNLLMYPAEEVLK